MSEEKFVDLSNLGNGAAQELFQMCLAEVIENILDPNTSDTAKREIVLKVGIKPGEGRTFGSVEITCNSKLAAAKGYATQMYFGKKNGQHLATEYNPQQMNMFVSDNLKALPRNEAQGGEE